MKALERVSQGKPTPQDVETLWADWSADPSGYNCAWNLAYPLMKPTAETLARLGIECEVNQYGEGKALYASSAPQWAKETPNLKSLPQGPKKSLLRSRDKKK